MLLVPPIYLPTPPLTKGGQGGSERRGVILLVVMSLLVLFSAVGISFVYYAEAESVASRTNRESGSIGSLTKAHADPEKLLAHFLSQLIYDTTDVSSSLRGWSLARNMYGFKTRSGVVTGAAAGTNNWIRITSADHGLQTDDIVTISDVIGFPKAFGAFPISFVSKDQFDLKNSSALGQVFTASPPGTKQAMWVSLNRADLNTMPYNGAGRVNAAAAVPAGMAATLDRDLINYTLFPADRFLRNPEFFTPVPPAAPAPPVPATYVASNVSWTYPDRDNLFLGAMNSKGEILSTSFFRSWLTAVSPTRYSSLRPDLQLHPSFPAVADLGGDVKNVDNASKVAGAVNNDSRWMYTGHPVLTGPDGRKYTVVFAPFITDLDGKVNVNAHGNIRANGALASNTFNASNQGFGPWEVSLAPVLPNSYKNIFVGNTAILGRYGGDGSPGAKGNSIAGLTPASPLPFYSGFDLDGVEAQAPLPNPTSKRLLLPGELGNPNPPYFAFPAIPIATYGSGNAAEKLNHPALFNYFNPTYMLGVKSADDRVFGPSNMDALLRHGSAGSPSSLSEIYRLCSSDFVNNRLKLTTMSFDMGRPGGRAWLAPMTATVQFSALANVTFTYDAGSATTFTFNPTTTTAAQIQANLNTIGALTGKVAVSGGVGGPYKVVFATGIEPTFLGATTVPAGAATLTASPYLGRRGGAVLAATPLPLPKPPRPITINTGSATSGAKHRLTTGSRVVVTDVNGLSEANGSWTVSVLNDYDFQLQGSNGVGTYSAGGTWTELYPTGGVFATPTFPATPPLAPNDGEFIGGWRSIAGQMTKLPLNRTFKPYPTLPASGRIGALDPVFNAAQKDRQAFAEQVFERLRLATTGVPPGVPYPLVYPSAQYSAHQWLAQLAVNIVDFMDTDDYITHFNWDPARGPVAIQGTKKFNPVPPMSEIEVTSPNHGLETGANIEIIGALDPNATTPINVWTVTRIDANRFTLNGSSTAVTKAAGGFWFTKESWVYGVENPKLLMNEAYAEMENTTTPPDPGGAAGQAALPFRVSVWLELFNPLRDDPNLKELPTNVNGGVRLRMPALPGPQYSIYTVQVVKPGASFHSGPTADPNLGQPADSDLLTEVYDYTKDAADIALPACDTEVVLPSHRGGVTNYSELPGGDRKNLGFYLLGPKQTFPGTVSSTLRVKEQVVFGKQKGLTYEIPATSVTEANRLNPPKILLRRLAVPNLKDDSARFLLSGLPNPDYNPYVTVDTIPALNLNDRCTRNTVNGSNPPMVYSPPAMPVDLRGPIRSYGRRQPYAANLMVSQTPDTNWPATPGTIDRYTGEPQHTFFRHNGVQSTPPLAPDPYGGVQTLATKFDWLPHFDRPLTSPMDLLHVAMVKPHELTDKFMTGNGTLATERFTHTHAVLSAPAAPAQPTYTGKLLWFDPSTRLHRFFEMVDSGYRAQGVSFNGRIPGKININTALWANDPVDVLLALADHQGGVSSYGSGELVTILDKLREHRTKGTGGVTSENDRPFKSLASGLTPAGDVFTSNGVEDTLLRKQDPSADTSLFQVGAATDNPVRKYELLGKIFNNVTTRSNVFAVWLTAGFFDVTDGPITRIATGGVTGTGPYAITPLLMKDSINGVPWEIKLGMHVWIADPAGLNTQHATVQSVTATTFTVNVPIKPSANDVIGVKCVLGAEVGAAENKNIRHRMFAVIDRSNLTMPTVLTTTRQAIALPAGSKTVQVDAVVGTSTWIDPSVSVQSQWSLVPGMRLVVDRGVTGVEETVTVSSVNRVSNPPTFTAGFNKAHAAGATITPEGVVDPLAPGKLYGNPGPQPNFELRKQSAVVPYFSVIQ